MGYNVVRGDKVGLTLWETKGVIERIDVVAEFQLTIKEYTMFLKIILRGKQQVVSAIPIY